MARRKRDFVFYRAAIKCAETLGLVENDDFDPSVSPVFEGRSEKFRARRVEGHRCLVYRPSGRTVVAYWWLSSPGEKVPLTPWLSFRVPQDITYVWDCRTDERFQRRGYYTAGLREIANGGPCLIAAETDNDPAIKAVVRAGFERAFVLRSRNVGPVNIVNGRIVGGCLDALPMAARMQDDHEPVREI